MDKIKNIGNIFEIARSQISKHTKSNTAKKQPQASKKPKPQKLSSNELKKSISKKLRSIDKNSENYRQQSNEIFLESVLLWEFGEDLINDSNFHQMITKISTAIDHDKETAEKFSVLIQQLTVDNE